MLSTYVHTYKYVLGRIKILGSSDKTDGIANSEWRCNKHLQTVRIWSNVTSCYVTI